MVTPLAYAIRWGKHPSNISTASCNLFNSQMLVDVTLAADGVQIQAHKLVLAASSVYFQALFTQNPCQHPIVILKDVSIEELRIIVDFVYKGEVEVPDDKLTSVLKTARLLRINGFAEAVLNDGDVRGHTLHHTMAGKPMPIWASSSSSSNSSGQGSGLYSSFPSEPEFEQRGVGSPDNVEPKRKVAQPAPTSVHQPKASQLHGVPVQHSELSPGSAAYQGESTSRETHSVGASSLPAYSSLHYTSLPQLTHQDNVPFRKRMRREFRRERSLSGGEGSQTFPERTASVMLPVRSTSHVESSCHALLSPEVPRPPMQTQTSDPGPLRTSGDDRPLSPAYTSKARKMLQRQPRIQRQVEQEVEDAAARRVAAMRPRPSPTIIVTTDDETVPPEVICARKSTPDQDRDKERPGTPDSDASAKDLSIEEGVWAARSCPPSPPGAKTLERSVSSISYRERRSSTAVISPLVPVQLAVATTSSLSSVAVSSASIPTTPTSGGHHCPESRSGSAVSCDHCWNRMDDKGRVQRRKTKYWCPKCRANLCIVPCFQQYHESGVGSGSGGEVGSEMAPAKSRSPFERSASSSSATSHLLSVPKNLSKTSSI